jgi:predicted ribosome quality control (RQC) complex YloA/Tae2 family protein
VLTLVLVLSAVAAAAALLAAVRLFQMDNLGAAQESLSRTVSPALYAVSTRLDSLQQALTASLTATLQAGLQNLAGAIAELREETRSRVDDKLHQFATELRATFDALAEWLETRLRSSGEPDVVAQLTAALDDRLTVVQNRTTAALAALEKEMHQEVARHQAELQATLEALQRTLNQTLQALQSAQQAAQESLRLSLEHRFAETLEQHTDTMRALAQLAAELRNLGERLRPTTPELR